jgi:hypothetical protein
MADSVKIADPSSPGSGAKDGEPPRVGGPLDGVNDGFHAAYGGAREEAKLDAPVFIVHGDVLFVVRRGVRHELALTPRNFHLIKSAAHAPVAIFAALHRSGDHMVETLHASVAASLASLDAEHELDRETARAIRDVLDASLSFLERVLGPRRPTDAELETFARASGPQLLRLTTLATRVQLRALHEVVDKALAELDPEERAGLQVVVTGDHQARVRSLGMQYFRKRFREPEGAEDRVTYAEGVDDVDQALALVGTRRFDEAIAKAFFGDPKRLQRDVLGDAVHALLLDTELAPIA